MEAAGYKPLSKIGSGNYGNVYLCKGPKGLNCVKHIEMIRSVGNPKIAEEHRQMVAREIYLLANLQHPRIVRCEHFFQDKDAVYIVMEYVSLGNLHTLLSERTTYFSQKMVLTLFCDLLLGIEYLHLRHVIHRDIKPENILIGSDCRLKIADFGISKIHTTDENNVSQPGTHRDGTLLYMAPEAIMHFEFSFASDIWALGCCIYEISLLHQPFHLSKTWQELYEQTIHFECLPLPAEFSEEFALIVDTMLQPKVKKRATIKWIVAQPLMMRRYYGQYFEHTN